MNRLRALLRDRRRAQRGSVLSGVLIMVAFLAIISGALVTELSTHFLISRTIVNRVANEATVNSAMELALDQLQNTSIASGCPGLTNMPPVNGRTASVSYISCWPAVRESPKFNSIASSAPFNIDGTHSVIPGTGQDLYVVGDSNGNIYAYQFGQFSPIWTMPLNTTITGPPMAMQDAACRGGGPCPDTGGAGGINADITYLVPITGGGGSGCSAPFCVELLGQDVPNPPDVTCFLAANARVTSRPAAGVAYPQVAYFGDSGGTLYAYDATEFSCANPSVQPITKTNPGSAAIVGGPVVVRNGARDEIYVVTSKGSTAQLLWYEYQQGPLALTLKDSLTLPFSNPIGLAAENAVVAPRIAITFQNGGVRIYNTSGGDPTVAASTLLGASIGAAPYWCSCPAGPQIGAAGLNGTLYVLDANLTLVASYQVPGGSAIRTTPASDWVGEWYFGADDGYLYELQQTPGQAALVQVARYGAFGKVGSSVQVAGCPAGICIYLGSANNAYIVSLDARDAKFTVCLSNSPPTCSGDNPRLWAQVEIGSTDSPKTVHVQGWSYYSP